MNRVNKIIFLSLMTGVAMVLSIIESMIPLPFIAPGAKLGLANIISIAVVAIFGLKSAIAVVSLRCILIMLVAGNPIGFIYSIISGIFCVIIMNITYIFLYGYLSLMGISVIGAIAHNTAQIVVACIMLSTPSIFIYLPIMCLVSIFTGCFVGYTSIYIVENLSRYIADFKERGIK